MTDFRFFLKNVATIVACFAVYLIFAGCDDKGDNPHEFIVTFVSSDVPSQTVKDGEKVTKPENPTRSGYTFDAWYKETEFTNKWDFDTDVVESNLMLYAKWIENETHPVGFEMVFVQGGTFTMGSPEGVGYDWERPQHQVTLSSYSIGNYPVTQGLWVEVMGKPNNHHSSFGKGNNFPVERVNWEEIVGKSSSAVGYTVNGVTYYQDGFCYKFSQFAGDGKQYRLPTEAEWEYAARGGNQTGNYIYSGSNTINNVAWYGNNSNRSTEPVGTKAPNELGIYDMTGNVWEWCSDSWGDYTSTEKDNPTGSTSGTARVLRGGSCISNAESCRVASRGYSGYPYNSIINIGFRLACSSE